MGPPPAAVVLALLAGAARAQLRVRSADRAARDGSSVSNGGALETKAESQGADVGDEMVLEAAPFAFTDEDFAPVAGDLVLTTAVDWLSDTGHGAKGACPPVYAGAADVSGKVVWMDDPPLRCDMHDLATAVAEAGGRALVVFWKGHGAVPVRPGSLRNYHHGRVEGAVGGDGGGGGEAPPFRPGAGFAPTADVTTYVPAADVTASAPAAQHVARALREGAAFSVVLHPPSHPSAWQRMWSSPAYIGFRVGLSLAALEVLELCGCRAWAMWREEGRAGGAGGDGGAGGGRERSSLPLSLVVLGVEAVANTVRLVFVSVDPFQATGVLDSRVDLILRTADESLGTISTAVFLAFFATAASETAGLALPAPRCGRSSVWPCLVAFSLWALVLEVALAAALFSGAFGMELRSFKIAILSFCYPVLMGALSLATLVRVRRGLAGLPGPLLVRLVAHVHRCFRYSMAAAITGILLWWTAGWPRFFLANAAVFRLALISASYAKVDAFRPMAVAVPRGPLRRLRELGLDALRRAAQVTVRPPTPRIFPATPAPTATRRAATAVEVWAPLQPQGHVQVSEAQLLGVSLSFLSEVASEWADGGTLPTAAVAYHLGARMRSRLRGRSLAEAHAGTATIDGVPAVAAATDFVIHPHALDFGLVVSALEAYVERQGLDRDRCYFWMDVFSLPAPVHAHARAAGMPRGGGAKQARDVYAALSIDVQPLAPVAVQRVAAVARAAPRTALVVDRWEAPLFAGRAWCLFELALCGGTLSLAVPGAQLDSFRRALDTDPQRVASALGSGTWRFAQTSHHADKRTLAYVLRGTCASAMASAAWPGAGEQRTGSDGVVSLPEPADARATGLCCAGAAATASSRAAVDVGVVGARGVDADSTQIGRGALIGCQSLWSTGDDATVGRASGRPMSAERYIPYSLGSASGPGSAAAFASDAATGPAFTSALDSASDPATGPAFTSAPGPAPAFDSAWPCASIATPQALPGLAAPSGAPVVLTAPAPDALVAAAAAAASAGDFSALGAGCHVQGHAGIDWLSAGVDSLVRNVVLGALARERAIREPTVLDV